PLLVSSLHSISSFFTGSGLLRFLHSFPTRRSSDLHLHRRLGRPPLPRRTDRGRRLVQRRQVLQRRLRRVPRRHDAGAELPLVVRDRKSTRLNSSHRTISYAVFCLKKNNAAGSGLPP